MEYTPMQFEEAVQALMDLREKILPDDPPEMWREPLFGAIDALRPYL